jgi:type I restriction-modification system DNA methylase subunit
MTSAAIVQKLWNYCNVLRDDGMSYGDYVEQLTYLLFLKGVYRVRSFILTFPIFTDIIAA